MPRAIPRVFNSNLYIHKSERFSIISKWFSYAELSSFTSIRQYILKSPKITGAMPIAENCKFHEKFDSGEIPYLLFLESQAFLNRALSNFCAQLALHRADYVSWGIVTGYYSSFFALSGLIRLQGKARISTHNQRGLPRGFFLSISSTSSPQCVVFPNWKNYHEQTCSDFCNSYRNYNLFQNSFQDLLSLKEEDLLEEVYSRNTYNYDLEIGYKELESADYKRLDFRKISAKKVQLLPRLVTEPDPEMAYMARACSRIILLAATSWKIAKDSPILKHVFEKFLAHREQFIENVYGKESALGTCLLRFTRGRMKLN
jgi:hypothetical protein